MGICQPGWEPNSRNGRGRYLGAVSAVSSTSGGLRQLLWRPPRPHGETIADRTVSFLELFYDLVYVAVIGQAAHHLAEHVTVRGGRRVRGDLRDDLGGVGERVAVPRAPRP
jgi:hypothetical protein